MVHGRSGKTSPVTQRGRLWVEHEMGALEGPGQEPGSVKGAYFVIHNQWLNFCPRRWHGVETVQGFMVSVQFFSPAHLKQLPIKAWSSLIALGFPCQALQSRFTASLAAVPSEDTCEPRSKKARHVQGHWDKTLPTAIHKI